MTPLRVGDATPLPALRMAADRTALDPSYAALRARILLALSLLNHRACPDLDADDVTAVRQALLGEWDA